MEENTIVTVEVLVKYFRNMVATGRIKACIFWKYAQPEPDLFNKQVKKLNPDMTRLVNK